MTTPPARTSERLTLLKWFSIIVPAIAIYATETVRHTWIEPLLPVGDMGNVIVGCIAFGCTFAFSHVVFRIIDSNQSELVRRQAELEAINTLTADTGAAADPERLAQQVHSVLASLFPADLVQVDMRPPAQIDAAVTGARLVTGRFAPDSAVAPAPAAASPEEPAPAPASAAPSADTHGVPDQMTIPLESHRAVVGSITITRTAGTFAASERSLLHLIGDTVTMTIRNATLQQELRSTAIAEERTWLAREMHDGIAQLLASMLVQIDMVEGRVREGDTERVVHDLQAVRTTAERANADVRAEIAGLRLLTDRDALLVNRVREYVEDFEDQTHIVASFTTNGGTMQTALPDLSLQLVRILQEALANVRKHSQATMVDVVLHVDGSGVELIVEDNGRGIPDARFGSGSSGSRGGSGGGGRRERQFGLATMQERAESQGGCLQITPASNHPHGTRVHARIPQRVQAIGNGNGNGAQTYVHVSAASAAG